MKPHRSSPHANMKKLFIHFNPRLRFHTPNGCVLLVNSRAGRRGRARVLDRDNLNTRNDTQWPKRETMTSDETPHDITLITLEMECYVTPHPQQISVVPAQHALPSTGVMPRPRGRTPLACSEAGRPVVRAMQPCASAHTPPQPTPHPHRAALDGR